MNGRLALAATLHCLAGCAVGEVLGMVTGTALAAAIAFPVNGWLIARGQGHALVHRDHDHHG